MSNSSPSSLNKFLSLFFFLHLTFVFGRQSWDEGTGQRLGHRMTTLQRFKKKKRRKVDVLSIMVYRVKESV
ncbi:hypothetical protein B4918_11020 [Bacillus thuringiensis]|uniref:Uncharacterized protein n=1 Tax=Bacillus thuringiensis TaxID=1428 RepID=A0A9W3TCU1_BACTU|nr:hypothetical protein B4918_11020 [Bacillus thuringiensis]